MALLSRGLSTTTEYKDFIKDLKDYLESLNITSQESYCKILDKGEIMMGKHDYCTNVSVITPEILEDVEIFGQYTSFYREFGKLIGVIFNKK